MGFGMFIVGVVFFTFAELFIVIHKPWIRKFMEEKPVSAFVISIIGSAVLTRPLGGAGVTITFSSGISTMICIMFYRGHHAIGTHADTVRKVKDTTEGAYRAFVKPLAHATGTVLKTSTKPVWKRIQAEMRKAA